VRGRIHSRIALLFLFLTALSVTRAEGAENLTTRNSEVLKDAVVRLQHTELMRVSRGRLKPNPIVLPHHTIYENVLLNQELIINDLTQAYENTLVRLVNLLDEYDEILPQSELEEIADYFQSELLSLYNLSGQVEEAETIIEIWRSIQSAMYGMRALPARARLACVSRRWLHDNYGHKNIPGPVRKELDTLMKSQGDFNDLFDMNDYLERLSGDYSSLFLRISGGAGSFPVPVPEGVVEE